MSPAMLPESVSTENQLKTFWSRPEGKTGVALIAAALGLGVWAWGSISTFLVGMLVDTVHIAELTALLAAMFWVAFSRRSHLLFRLLSRALTGLIIEIDPVGIAKDKILQMKKRSEQFAEQISNVAGQKRILEDTIAKNQKKAAESLQYAEAARKAQNALQTQLGARKAGRLQQANVSYQDLLSRIKTVYDMLVRFKQNTDYFIADTEDEVDQAVMRYKVTNAAYSAIRKGMAIIKGHADENDIYDRAMENLAESASLKLGAIDDFQRAIQPFMDTMDIQNAAVDETALKELDKYTHNILTNGDETTAFLLPGTTPTPEPVPVKRGAKDVPAKSYKDLLK